MAILWIYTPTWPGGGEKTAACSVHVGADSGKAMLFSEEPEGVETIASTYVGGQKSIAVELHAMDAILSTTGRQHG